jgi:RNA polymerase sigma-70 factor (ECF subfamily)
MVKDSKNVEANGGVREPADVSAESEREWIRRTQSGDHEAFSHVVRTHQARLRAFAARYLSSSDDVYDIVQDAFLSAFEHIDRFDLERDFGKWLRGICRNRMLKFFREQKTRSKALGIIAVSIEDHMVGVEEWLEKEDALIRIEALRGCVTQLEDSHRRLVGMRYYYEMAVKDIAENIDKSATAVSVQLMRIRGVLRKCMEKKIKSAQI